MNPPKSIKILMLVSSYPRSEEDSASIFLRYLAENLQKLGLDIHILTPLDNNATTTYENGIVIHRFRYFPKSWQKLAYGSGMVTNLRQTPSLWLQVPFFLVAMAYSLLRVIRKEHPDVIHAHWIVPQGLVALLGKFFFKIPILISAHGSDAFAFRNGLSRRLKRFILRNSDVWTANTRATANAIGEARSLPPPHIVPMGVDLERFSSGKRARLRDNHDLIILFVGRLVESKGVRDLLRAFSLLPDSLRARTSVWLIGAGKHLAQLQQDARVLGVSEKVRFWGEMRNDFLPDYYAAADLFVAPSVEGAWGETEGQGVVLLEAFAAHLCVVATRVGGIGEVITDGITGILVEPSNPHQLATVMSKLLTNQQAREELAENAFTQVQTDYGWDKISKHFAELYRKVL